LSRSARCRKSGSISRSKEDASRGTNRKQPRSPRGCFAQRQHAARQFAPALRRVRSGPAPSQRSSYEISGLSWRESASRGDNHASTAPPQEVPRLMTRERSLLRRCRRYAIACSSSSSRPRLEPYGIDQQPPPWTRVVVEAARAETPAERATVRSRAGESRDRRQLAAHSPRRYGCLSRGQATRRRRELSRIVHYANTLTLAAPNRGRGNPRRRSSPGGCHVRALFLRDEQAGREASSGRSRSRPGPRAPIRRSYLLGAAARRGIAETKVGRR